MNNDNHANYAKIGFAVFAGVLAIVGTLIYFGGIGADDHILIETYCDKSVSGLSVGSPVNFRGVKVGEVKEISFVGAKYPEVIGDLRIYVLMAVERRTLQVEDETKIAGILDDLVEKGLRVTVSASGITGLSHIECNIHASAPPPMEISWSPRYCYIPSTVSLLENFSDSATRVMSQLNRMDFKAAWSNVNSSISSLAAVSEGVARLIEGRRPDIDRIVENINEAVSSIREAADVIRRNPSRLLSGDEPSRLPETSE
ncbi:MAG: MCE family protein [Kiritimatiellae bacterium]|jgi:paraquat-inducible protein B|nr:MCE family protein [Kiritimatiellia bacterium]